MGPDMCRSVDLAPGGSLNTWQLVRTDIGDLLDLISVITVS